MTEAKKSKVGRVELAPGENVNLHITRYLI